MRNIIIYLSFLSLLYSNEVRIGSCLSVKGDVKVIYDDFSMPSFNAIPGNSLFNNVKVVTSTGSEVEIVFDDMETIIHLDQNSELIIKTSEISKNFDLAYGSMFMHNSLSSITDSYIFTTSTRAVIKNSKVWVTRDVSSGKDNFYCLSGEVRIYNDSRNTFKDISEGQKILSMNNGFVKVAKYEQESLPYYLKDVSVMSVEGDNKGANEYVHSDDKKKPHDLIPLYNQTQLKPARKNETSRFGINISLGRFLVKINDTSSPYFKMGLQPQFYSKQVQLKLDLDGFINVDGGDNLNELNDPFDYLDRLVFFQYNSFDKRFLFQFGQINSITFGHGHLVKGYSNILDYPRTRNSGVYFNYRTDKRNITVDGFISSVRDFQRGGGIIGVHTTIFLSDSFPLTVGGSFVRDFNQFAAVSDFGNEWENWYEENVGNDNQVKRSINSFQVDYTYDLLSYNNTKLYLFGEVVGMWYPDTYYYIRLGANPIEGSSGSFDYPLKISRDGTWGLTTPGFWIKYRHLWDIKVSLQINSAMHIPQYFSSTYNFERIRYAEYEFTDLQINDFSELTDLYCKYALVEDVCPAEDGITELLLPKEFYSLVDGTQNIFPTWGIVGEYDFHYKKLFSGNLSFSMFKEISDTDDSDTFYNYGVDIYSDDNIFEGISELRLYYKQFFTNNLPWSSDKLFHENVVRGAKIGLKINKFLSGIFDIHDVFYDHDLDGTVDIIRMSSLELQVRL